MHVFKLFFQNKMQIDLAVLIYATGCPLSMVENPHWLGFWSKWKPSFKPPNRAQISNTLLRKVFNDTKATVSTMVAATPSIGLICDGWTNIR